MRLHHGLIVFSVLLFSCKKSADHRGPKPSSTAAVSAAAGGLEPASKSVAPRPTSLQFIADDIPRAERLAKEQGKLLFVDVWAVWCHTCLSMKHYVLNDRALMPLSSRVVFAQIDSERVKNAAFLKQHPIKVWPSFFILEPKSDTVLGYWPGAASLREMQGFIGDALTAFDALKAKHLKSDSPLSRLVQAKGLQAHGEVRKAAEAYAALVESQPNTWPHRSEALFGWVQALHDSGKADACSEVGVRYLDQIQGAARPADFASFVLSCADRLHDEKAQAAAREKVIDVLRRLTESPSQELSADDQADALSILARAWSSVGDDKAAKDAYKRALAILEEAARRAPTPAIAATFDYARGVTYVKLGQPDRAIRMLEERMRQLPSSGEAAGRLAGILADLGRYEPALSAVNTSLEHSYGPRRLKRLALKAQILDHLQRYGEAVATLKQEVDGHKKLLTEGLPAPRLADANERYRQARIKQQQLEDL